MRRKSTVENAGMKIRKTDRPEILRVENKKQLCGRLIVVDLD